jgi:hypothetical protein
MISRPDKKIGRGAQNVPTMIARGDNAFASVQSFFEREIDFFTDRQPDAGPGQPAAVLATGSKGTGAHQDGDAAWESLVDGVALRQ